MKAFFAIPTAGVGFFFSSWLAMLFWGILTPDFGLQTISYVKAMVVTISLWLVVAPPGRGCSRQAGIGWLARRKMAPRVVSTGCKQASSMPK